MKAVKRNQKLLLLLTEAMLLLLLLPGCFRKAERLDYTMGEKIVLTPGVYELHVESALQDGQRAVVEVKSDEAFYHSLRTNAVTILPNERAVSIQAWVTQKIQDAYVECEQSDSEGMETAVTLQPELYRTAKGNRILFVVTGLGIALLNGILAFRRAILDNRITKKQQMVCWMLGVGILIASFPYLTDYITLDGNTSVYLWRIVKLAEGTWGRTGTATLGDLFLLLPAGLKLLGFPMVTVYRFFVFWLVAATAIIAYDSFYRCVKEEYAALFGSMIYLLMPYHLFELYSRGAVGEYLIMAFLPLVGCGIYLLCQKSGCTVRNVMNVVVGVLLVWAGATITVEETDTGSAWQLGAGALVLLTGYILWRIRGNEKGLCICDLCAVGSVAALGLKLLQIPGRWMMAAMLFVAYLAAFYMPRVQRIQAGKRIILILMIGTVTVLTVFSSVYHVNRIAYTSKAVYLYEARNMTILYQETEPVLLSEYGE